MSAEKAVASLKEATRLLQDEATIVGLVGEVLSAILPRCLIECYTIRGFPGRALGASRHFVASSEVPDSPTCREPFRELFLPHIRQAARESRLWVEAVGDGLLSAAELRGLLARRTVLGGSDVKEWGMLVAALGAEPIGGANVFVPAREPGFTAAERARIRALAPQLSLALRLAALVANAAPSLHALEHLLSSRADAVFLLSSDGQVLGASPGGERLLARCPEVHDFLRRGLRSATVSATTLPLPRLGLQAHFTPCSARGTSDAFLVVLGAEPSAAGRGRLSARQVELLDLVGEGMSNKEIARRMGLAAATVKSMLETLYRLAGVSGRVGLLRWRRPARPASAQEQGGGGLIGMWRGAGA